MMSPFDIIFLDMDGVICDFVGSVAREFPELPPNWTAAVLTATVTF